MCVCTCTRVSFLRYSVVCIDRTVARKRMCVHIHMHIYIYMYIIHIYIMYVHMYIMSVYTQPFHPASEERSSLIAARTRLERALKRPSIATVLAPNSQGSEGDGGRKLSPESRVLNRTLR